MVSIYIYIYNVCVCVLNNTATNHTMGAEARRACPTDGQTPKGRQTGSESLRIWHTPNDTAAELTTRGFRQMGVAHR